MPDALTLWPDIEDGVRQYLRDWPGLDDIIDRRVFFGVPKSATESQFPMITVFRVAGSEDGGEAPVDLATVQVQVWGSRSGGKRECTTMLNLVRQAFSELRARTHVTDDVDLFGATVQNVTWVPDPADDRPRYIVTAQVTGISS